MAAGKFQKLSRDEVGSALRAALLAALDRDMERAEELLLRLVRADSRDIPVYFALARVFRAGGDVGRAIRVHQNLLLRNDLDERQRLAALVQLAADFEQGGFLRRAIASFEEVLEREPKHGRALASLVDLHRRVRDYPRAIDLLRRRARADGTARDERDREEAELWFGLATEQAGEGNSDGARKSLKQALKKDREHVDGHALLAELEAEREKPKAALAAWKRVAELAPDRADDVFPRIEATYAALGKSGGFESYVGELLDRDPGNHGAAVARARALAARGETDEAVADLRRVLDTVPDDLRARIALGQILVAEHRENDAAKELGELLAVLTQPAAPASQESEE